MSALRQPCSIEGRPCRGQARAFVATLMLLVAILMASMFGLVTLIARGYGILTFGFIAVFVVPVLTIGVYRIITLGKSNEAES